MIVAQLVRLMRPHQYTKNLLVFAAPGAAGRLDEGSVLATAFAAFVLFCLVSSAGYVANDLLDAEADRQHPAKRHRPIASEAVSRPLAGGLLVVLALTAIGCAALVDRTFFVVLVGYAALTAVYSTLLKRTPWIELVAVSAGFVLRAVAGGAATDTPVSGWFLLVVSAGALLLIAGKRLGELVTLGPTSRSRAVLARYTTPSLRLLSALAAALAITGYATWAAAEASDQAGGSPGSFFLRLTALPFVIAIGRYLTLSWRGGGEMPERVVLRDPVILLAGAGWAATYSLGIYA